MAATRTPGPMRADGTLVLDEDGYLVLDCQRLWDVVGQNEANAAFVALAWNCHDALVEALTELRALVKGECPSLLNEDSGGDALLDMEINQALALAKGKTP